MNSKLLKTTISDTNREKPSANPLAQLAKIMAGIAAVVI
jgi:hypothetical protein